MKHQLLVVAVVVMCAASFGLRAAPGKSWNVALDSPKDLELRGVKASTATHEGKTAVRLVEEATGKGEPFAIVPGPELQDGEIEVDLAGRPAGGASETARGFVGVAFRVRPQPNAPEAFECFYIRPTNGRADDQLRRNHSTQYISVPGFPWELLRRDFPGVYESYVDLESGKWTHLRIEFRARRASLYVNRAPQPVLIVKDLKQAPAAGRVALWIGSETEGFFRDLRVTASAEQSQP